MMLSMIGSLQVLIVENIQYISVSSELFKKKTPNYALKFFTRLLATISAFAWLLHIDSVNDIIKIMISTNIILGWLSMMIDTAAISWVIFFAWRVRFTGNVC